jgi:hypothetical protein
MATNKAELETHVGDVGGIPAKGKGKTKSKGQSKRSNPQQQEAVPHDGKGMGKGKGKRSRKGLGKDSGFGNKSFPCKGKARSIGKGTADHKGPSKDIGAGNVVGKGCGRSTGGDARSRAKQSNRPKTTETTQTSPKHPRGGRPQIKCKSVAMEPALLVSLEASSRDYYFTQYDWEYTCLFFDRYDFVKASIDKAGAAAKLTFTDLADAQAAMTELNGKVFNRPGRDDHTKHNWKNAKFVIHIEWQSQQRSPSPVLLLLGQPAHMMQGADESDVASEATPDADSETEVASMSSSERLGTRDQSTGGICPDSDDDFDFWSQWHEEIEALRDEFPDLDSDALADVRDARIQDDCDEFGGYCSGGS